MIACASGSAVCRTLALFWRHNAPTAVRSDRRTLHTGDPRPATLRTIAAIQGGPGKVRIPRPRLLLSRTINTKERARSFEAERIEQVALLPVEPPHHHPPPAAASPCARRITVRGSRQPTSATKSALFHRAGPPTGASANESTSTCRRPWWTMKLTQLGRCRRLAARKLGRPHWRPGHAAAFLVLYVSVRRFWNPRMVNQDRRQTDRHYAHEARTAWLRKSSTADSRCRCTVALVAAAFDRTGRSS
jgi:hypothetical protein